MCVCVGVALIMRKEGVEVEVVFCRCCCCRRKSRRGCKILDGVRPRDMLREEDGDLGFVEDCEWEVEEEMSLLKISLLGMNESLVYRFCYKMV